MSLWLVRAGRHGEQEQGALEHSVVTIGLSVQKHRGNSSNMNSYL
jgi:predicted Mrr-cat superfamily restriction endonuclease